MSTMVCPHIVWLDSEFQGKAKEKEMAKKQHLGVIKLWGIRSRFKLLLLVILTAVVAVAVFVTEPENMRLWKNSGMSPRECDLFSGRWVLDNVTYPLYSEGGCSFMSDQLACEKYGRQDVRYQNWRWQPHQCSLPKFNATTMLERLRGKRLVFVGDSLNRGQWVSMVCLLEASIPPPHKSMHSNGSLITFKAMEYNASVEFYWAPLLVESNSDDPVKHRLPDRIVRVESIEKHAKHWEGAHILVFNSYLWWRSRTNMKVLWGSVGCDENGVYEEIEMLSAFRMALKTWSDWLEAHADPVKTKIFFVSMSPTHMWADEWGGAASQNCYKEMEIIEKRGYWGRGSDVELMKAVEAAVAGLRAKTRGLLSVQILNITQLSEYRKDGHPSIYRKQWEALTQQQLDDPTTYADCIHWCLPGVPDTWNELLYAYILSSTTTTI